MNVIGQRIEERKWVENSLNYFSLTNEHLNVSMVNMLMPIKKQNIKFNQKTGFVRPACTYVKHSRVCSSAAAVGTSVRLRTEKGSLRR